MIVKTVKLKLSVKRAWVGFHVHTIYINVLVKLYTRKPNNSVNDIPHKIIYKEISMFS